jgi:hypothetical protein
LQSTRDTALPRGAFDCRVLFWIAVVSFVLAGLGCTPAGAQPAPAAGQAASMFSAEEVRAIKAASIALWRAGEDVAAIEAGRRRAGQPACGPTGACQIARGARLAQWARSKGGSESVA